MKEVETEELIAFNAGETTDSGKLQSRIDQMQDKEKIEKRKSIFLFEMQQLLDMEKKVYDDQVNVEKEVQKETGHKKKLLKLKALLDESMAQHILETAKMKLQQFKKDSKNNELYLKQQALQKKRKKVKDKDLAYTRAELQQAISNYDTKNIDYFV